MLGAHPSYVHRLESAYTSVVLDLHTGEVAQGIRHADTAQSLELHS